MVIGFRFSGMVNFFQGSRIPGFRVIRLQVSGFTGP